MASDVNIDLNLATSSLITRNKKKSIAGVLAVPAIAFGVTAGTMLAVEAGTGIASLSAVTSAMPFLGFLATVGPVFGILAFAAILAAAALIVYGAAVLFTHYASNKAKPAPAGDTPALTNVVQNTNGQSTLETTSPDASNNIKPALESDAPALTNVVQNANGESTLETTPPDASNNIKPALKSDAPALTNVVQNANGESTLETAPTEVLHSGSPSHTTSRSATPVNHTTSGPATPK